MIHGLVHLHLIEWLVTVLLTMMCNKTAPKIDTYLGFGIGPKSCPGQEMARIQTILLNNHLITKCRYNRTSYSLFASGLHVIFFNVQVVDNLNPPNMFA